MRKTQVMTHVLVPQAVRAMLPAIISQLVVTLKDTSLGFLITYPELLYAGKLIASNPAGYPVRPMSGVIAPIYIAHVPAAHRARPWIEARGRRGANRRTPVRCLTDTQVICCIALRDTTRDHPPRHMTPLDPSVAPPPGRRRSPPWTR